MVEKYKNKWKLGIIKMDKKSHWSKTHVMIGLGVLAVLYYFNLTYKWIEVPVDNKSIITLGIVAIIFSMLPDIDSPTSTISKYATIGLGGIILYSFYVPEYRDYGIIAVIVLVLLRIVGHRKIIHSVLFALIISSPLLYLGKIYFIVGVVAYISHIVSDDDFSWGFEKEDWRI